MCFWTRVETCVSRRTCKHHTESLDQELKCQPSHCEETVLFTEVTKPWIFNNSHTFTVSWHISGAVWGLVSCLSTLQHVGQRTLGPFKTVAELCYCFVKNLVDDLLANGGKWWVMTCKDSHAHIVSPQPGVASLHPAVRGPRHVYLRSLLQPVQTPYRDGPSRQMVVFWPFGSKC